MMESVTWMLGVGNFREQVWGVSRERHQVAVTYIEAQRRRQSPGPPEPPVRLSPRLREVLALLAADLSDAEIADPLSIERTTVEEYVSRLRQRLGATTRAGLVVIAFRKGVLR